jgi:hypothetical protein
MAGGQVTAGGGAITGGKVIGRPPPPFDTTQTLFVHDNPVLQSPLVEQPAPACPVVISMV